MEELKLVLVNTKIQKEDLVVQHNPYTLHPTPHCSAGYKLSTFKDPLFYDGSCQQILPFLTFGQSSIGILLSHKWWWWPHEDGTTDPIKEDRDTSKKKQGRSGGGEAKTLSTTAASTSRKKAEIDLLLMARTWRSWQEGPNQSGGPHGWPENCACSQWTSCCGPGQQRRWSRTPPWQYYLHQCDQVISANLSMENSSIKWSVLKDSQFTNRFIICDEIEPQVVDEVSELPLPSLAKIPR